MKRFALGMAGCLLVLILIYFGFCTKVISPSVMEQVPDWIKGSLIMNVQGIKHSSADELTDQYLCEFNFDTGRIFTTEVWAGAELIKDLNTGETLIVYPANDSYAWRDPGSDLDSLYGYISKKWRSYHYNYVIPSSVVQQLQTKYGGRITDSFAPLAILGLSDAPSILRNTYLLQYGVSDGGQQEIHLGSIAESATDNQPVFKLYARFDLNERLHFFNYDISKDGKIAWSHSMDEVYVSNGTDTIKLQDSEVYTRALCWIDSETLLYVANTTTDHRVMGEPYDFTLRLWHIKTNSIEDVASLEGKEFGLASPPDIMAYDEINELLALYCTGSIECYDSILIYSLRTGEYYDFIPWQKDYYDANGEWLDNYGLSDDGTLFFDPLDKQKPQLIWCTK